MNALHEVIRLPDSLPDDATEAVAEGKQRDRNMSVTVHGRHGSAIRSPDPSFYEDATLYADLDGFKEAVRDSDTDNPKNVVVAVPDGAIPAPVLDFAEENGYALHYIMSDGSEVGLKKVPEKSDFAPIGVLISDG